MKKYKCIEVKSEKHKRMFLDFPSRVYLDGDCPQNIEMEKQILNRKHVISSDIEIFPYIVLDETNGVVCRCLMTYYKDDPVAYLGFFESFNNATAVKHMFFEVERKAFKDGKTKILGPIDASIYINYSFKVDRFDKTYTGEPYNKKYYADLWKQAGYEICDKYVSNQLRKVEEKDIELLKKEKETLIPVDFDYDNLPSLTNEVKEKLKLHKPYNIEVASRISGITPASIMTLIIALKKYN